MIASGQPPDPPAPARVSLFVRLIATGFYVGYIPWASGTFGSLLGLLLCLIPALRSATILPALVVLGFGVGVYTAGKVAAVEGNSLSRSAAAAKALFQPGAQNHPDPSIVVIDEIVGMWIAVLLLPPGTAAYAVAFASFRFFDIVKPEPARSLERLPGGWGIMLDDVVAGIYANAATRIALYLFALISGGTP